MPAVAKKNKKVPAKDADESVESPEKRTVVSGQLQKAIHNKKAAKKYKPRRGVVFIRHLPHGFFEEQLKNYFQQFGAVTRVRLARSARTGNSKGFAYVEFAMPEVAQIAAETMDNYLMFRKLVNATYIPPESQRFNYFKTSLRKVQNKFGKSIYVSHATRAAHRKVLAVNKPSEEKIDKQTKQTIKKLNKLKERFADLGIDFDDYVAKPDDVSTTNEADTSVSSAVESPSPKNKPGSLLKIKQPATKSKEIPLKRLLEETIDEEDSSEDDDFQPDESSINETPEKKPVSIKKTAKQVPVPKTKEIPLKRLLEETIEEDDSSDDDDFQPSSSEDETPQKQPVKKSKTIEKVPNKKQNATQSKKQSSKQHPPQSYDSSFVTTSSDDKSPQKKPAKKQPSKKVVNVKQAQDDRLEKIMKRNKQDGKIQKKGKKQQEGKGKSQALQKKIQDTAKMIVQDKKVAVVKSKDLKKKKKNK